MDAEHEHNVIADAMDWQIKRGAHQSSTLYGDGHAGKRIAEALLAW